MDRDPLLVALGQALGGVHIVQDDLRGSRWPKLLGCGPGSVDLVTACCVVHMLSGEDLARIYRLATRLLRPGAALVVADRMGGGPGWVDGLRTSITQASDRRARPTDDTWDGWWAAARREPAFAALVEERVRVRVPGGDDDRPALQWQAHARLMAAAGLRVVEPVWSRGQDVILVGLR